MPKKAPAKRTVKAAAGKATKRGLTVKTFKGLNEKRMANKSNKNYGKRISMKPGDTVVVQFLQGPDDFLEYEQHVWQDGSWNFVPCLGDGCPLCQDEDEKKAKQNYCFAVNVYNFGEKKVQLLTGPKDLAQRIFYRYTRAPGKFLKRTYEITKFPSTPVTYGVDTGEEETKKVAGLKLYDLEEYVEDEAKAFYGDEMPETVDLDADDDAEEDDEDLDDDDADDDEDDDSDSDDEDDEDEDDEDEDDEDEDDEDDDDDEEDDDEDEDDDDDDEDDDEDEPVVTPPPSKSKAKKSAPAKKAAAKKPAAKSKKK